MKRTSIQILGIFRRKLLYFNQTYDFFVVTKLNMQMNLKILRIVANLTLVNRVVISRIALNEVSANIIYYFTTYLGFKR